MICLNAAAVMTGAFPLIFVISKLLAKPLKVLGKLIRINETSSMGLIASLATSMTTLGMMKDMDDKGAMINSAFAVITIESCFTHFEYIFRWFCNIAVPIILILGRYLAVSLQV